MSFKDRFIYNSPNLTLWSKPPKDAALTWGASYCTILPAEESPHHATREGPLFWGRFSVAWLAHCLQPLFLIITGKFSVYNLRTGDTVVLEHTFTL